MGLQNDMIMESIKKNNEEIAKKQAAGEKLSFENWFILTMQIGLLLCSLAFSVFIIRLLFVIDSDKSTERTNVNASTKSEVIAKNEIWTMAVKDKFIADNAKSDFDKFVLTQLISENKATKGVEELNQRIYSEEFKMYRAQKIQKYMIVVDKIAGKSKSEVEAILGKSENAEKVNPSKVGCPCEKNTYLDDLVEIVFINNKSDWITINHGSESEYVDFTGLGDTKLVKGFDNYMYIKVSTK